MGEDMDKIRLSDFLPLHKSLEGFYFFEVDARTCSTRYLIVDGERRMLIDSGDGKDALDFIPDLVFLTHGHYDHTGGVRADWPDVRIHEAEDESLPFVKIPQNVKRIGEGNIEFNKFSFEVILTPGHTIGSACLFERKMGILFSGDTKFADGGYGRTDLGGSDEEMEKSLAKIEKLPYRLLCPGHGRIEWRE